MQFDFTSGRLGRIACRHAAAAAVATWVLAINPLAHAEYATASEATFVGDGDMVLAVVQHGEAVAYPVRLMAYHHIAQDVVGGVPLVATY